MKSIELKRSAHTKNHTVDWLFRNIRYLGHVVHFDIDYFDEYSIFQDLLDSIDADNDIYDTQEKFEFKVPWQIWILSINFLASITNTEFALIDFAEMWRFVDPMSMGLQANRMHQLVQVS